MLNLIFAQNAPAGNGGGFGGLGIFIYIAVIFGIVYFMLLRPQKKKDAERRKMLDQIKRGDKVITIGGIHGEVDTVRDKFVILRVNAETGATLKVSRNAVHNILTGEAGEEEQQ